MPELELKPWFARVQKAEHVRDVFNVLDEFRRQEWSDDDRAKMAKYYLRVVEKLAKANKTEEVAAVDAPQNDGPVWYEKM